MTSSLNDEKSNHNIINKFMIEIKLTYLNMLNVIENYS